MNNSDYEITESDATAGKHFSFKNQSHHVGRDGADGSWAVHNGATPKGQIRKTETGFKVFGMNDNGDPEEHANFQQAVFAAARRY
ncbi:MAG: hypothetical protein ACTJHU_00340 [Mycetocola sp.]